MYEALTQEHSLRYPTLVASYVSLYSIHVSSRRWARLKSKSPNNLREDERKIYFHISVVFTYLLTQPYFVVPAVCVCVGGGEREREKERETDVCVCACVCSG